MPRIRSVHPGLSTDEAYMSMSLAAKAAWPMLWTECDDQGVFEWKPLVLKARIFPADNVDMDAVLGEYQTLGQVKRFEANGKGYGLVRNFCKYQRPKKPSITHPMPPEFRTYVGLKGPSSPQGEVKEPSVPHQFPTGTEKSPQMEDGGWRMEEGIDNPLSPRPTITQPDDDFERVDRAIRAVPGIDRHPVYAAPVIAPIWSLVQKGYDLKADILPTIQHVAQKAKPGSIRNWAYIAAAIADEKAKAAAVTATAPTITIDWQERIDGARHLKAWDPTWGPWPHQPGCLVPRELLKPTDGAGWTEWKPKATA